MTCDIWKKIRRRPTLVGDGVSVAAGARVEHRVSVDVGGERGVRAGHDLDEMLLVRHGRSSDGVAPVRAPRRQPLTVQQDVVSELAPRDDDQYVVKNHSSLPCTDNVLVKANIAASSACC